MLILGLGTTILPVQAVNAAGEWHVDPEDSIQMAIEAADSAGGGTIHVADGIYYEQLTLKSNVLLVAENTGGAIVDAEGAGPAVIAINVDSSAEINGFVITGGSGTYQGIEPYYWYGGGMYNENSYLNIINCIFTGNSAHEGAGILNGNSSPTIDNCQFVNNTAAWYGGGIYNMNNSNPVITNCTFTGNRAANGGGINNEYSAPVISNCVFTENTATQHGGGAHNDIATPTYMDCSFIDNQARIGGGMHNIDSTPQISRCIFSGNSATLPGDYGGGGMFNNNSSPAVTDCEFTDNYACLFGGAINNYNYSSPVFTNCIFSDNLADSIGGAVFNFNDCSSVYIGCIFTNNVAFGGDTGGGVGGGMYITDNMVNDSEPVYISTAFSTVIRVPFTVAVFTWRAQAYNQQYNIRHFCRDPAAVFSLTGMKLDELNCYGQ